jgi:CHAD domain-containing protein
MTGPQARGDRTWQDAGRETVRELTKLVQKRAKAIDGDVGADPVHDMRTATRRLRTAIELYADDAPKKQRADVEDELKRISRRLGEVRDLDVLLETLDGAAPADIDPLRNAWRDERATGARRLKNEIARRRFHEALKGTKRLLAADADSSNDGPGANVEIERVATEAPGLIWDAFGTVLGYEIDPKTADPAAIHQLRIAAKKLRYTLEAFEDALAQDANLIEDVTALQDAAGSMHDAIVAGQRARETVPPNELSKRERKAIDAYADGQARQAEQLRPTIARRLRTIRSRGFRESLGRALAGMGHVSV